MIDHLVQTDTFPPPENNPPNWADGSRAIAPVQVWRETDENGAPVYLPGRWLLIRTEALDPELQAMTGYCWAWSDDLDDFVDLVSGDDLEPSVWWA